LDKLYRPFGFGLLVPKHLSFIILLFGFRIFRIRARRWSNASW